MARKHDAAACQPNTKMLSLEQIPQDLETHLAAARQRMSRSGATVGWFCATVLIFDIVLTMNRQPGPTAALYRLVRDATAASSHERLDSYALWFVLALQAILALGMLALGRSPWRHWARQSLRNTRPHVLLRLLITSRPKNALLATQETDHGSTSVSRVRAAIDILVQLLTLGLLAWATTSMEQQIGTLRSLPEWLWWALQSLRWVSVVLGAWLVSAVLRRIAHTGTVVGIATGFLSVLALLLLISQRPGTVPAIQYAVDISVWTSAALLALLTAFAAAQSLDKPHDHPRETVVGPGLSSVPFLAISKRDGRLVHQIKYKCDLGNSGVLILRDDGRGQHMLEPRRPILSPFEYCYEILNLSTLDSVPALALSIDTPGDLYRLHLRLSVNSVNNAQLQLLSSSEPIRGLDSRVVQLYLDIFFRHKGRSRDLDMVMQSILRDWFRHIQCNPGTWWLRAGNLGDSIRNAQARVPTGATEDPESTRTLSGMKVVADAADSPEDSRRLYLRSKAEIAATWIRELESLRAELRRLDSAIASAPEDLGKMFASAFNTAMSTLQGENSKPEIQATSRMLGKLFDVRLQDVKSEKLPALKECDERLNTLSDAIQLDKDFEGLVRTQEGRVQNILSVIHTAAKEGVSVRQIIGEQQWPQFLLPNQTDARRSPLDREQGHVGDDPGTSDEV